MSNENKPARNRPVHTAPACLLLILLTAPAAIAQESSTREESAKGLQSEEFAQDATWMGIKEITLSELAEQKAQKEEVRQFARMMVNDHKAANQKLRSLAEQRGIDLPVRADFLSAEEGEEFGEKLEPAKRRDIDAYHKLQSLEGAELDKHYMREMVKDHNKAVAYFERASKRLTDPELKQFADEQLPKLQEHQQEAQRIVQMIHKGGEGRE